MPLEQAGIIKIEPNYVVTGVNNLSSRPVLRPSRAVPIIPFKKQVILFLYLTFDMAVSNAFNFPTEFEESVLDCIPNASTCINFS